MISGPIPLSRTHGSSTGLPNRVGWSPKPTVLFSEALIKDGAVSTLGSMKAVSAPAVIGIDRLGGRRCGNIRNKIQPWPGSSVGWSIALYTKGFGLDSRSGHIHESNNEYTNMWNNKATFLSLSQNQSIKKKER